MRIISLADSSPYETLHSFVSNTLAPYFKSYVKRGAESGKITADTSSAKTAVATDSSGGGGVGSGGASNGVPNSSSSSSGGGGSDQATSLMEKKIAEVEMGFLHLQQNIEIPEINLIIHPLIMQMIKRCQEEGRGKPKVDDFANKVDDAHFLNQLQAGVSRWIREIKKVTKLDRDPSTGTALQEISFWLNLERALNRILEKRESLEVTLTLDILRWVLSYNFTLLKKSTFLLGPLVW